MKKLIFKSIFFGLTLFISYILLDSIYNTKSAENTLFIWGDSQTYRGIDLKKIANETKHNVYSAAQHGAGVYDFLVFCKKVPNNSKVLVSISKPVLFRNKKLDRNSSGISTSSLKNLYKNNYSLKDLYYILKNNFNSPPNLFYKTNILYEAKDELNELYSLEYYVNHLKNIPKYYKDKQNLYLQGLEILKNKKCKINLIIFPYDQEIEQIEINLPISDITNSFINSIDNKICYFRKDTFQLNEYKNYMYDRAHLNELGASFVSDYLKTKLDFNSCLFFIIKNGY